MSTSVPSSHDGHVRPAATTTTDRPADAGRPRRASAGGSLARIAVMTALMAVLGLVPPIAVAGVPAPIVLQNIAVILAGVILGPWRGAASMALFAGLVALGLPLLSGGRGGLGVFAGPTAGFILGWIPSALIVGLIFWALTSRARPGLGAGRVALGAAVAGLIGGVVMVYFFGVLGFVGIAGMEFGAAVLSMAPFVPGDLIKLVVAVILIVGLWKAYPRAFR
ncbi:biotin transporter BioY [Micrococcus luteus]|mgnify:FL=1|uniref:biotin transporter BioY n=1 Tax=Micrococcus luteus TaxID=1270 RepID=UPI000D504FA9|nr:biotin transporter BioY [Micrococcus luteus]AWD25254.1 BioY family protein [Micrococcus luteus]MBY0170686.1 biotin transporter BioY [Micrococcus luteus]MBY0174075.1 biotin transporter BioY [Micrococcus luteus]MCM3481467.1 biotin transporter BioY [Micrococcus luteus]MCV7452463.1 biotin transporter BioY [Micrococcus luteus]